MIFEVILFLHLGLVKIEVRVNGTTCTTSMEAQLLHERIEALLSRTKPRSHQTDKLITELKDEGIELLNSQLDRQVVIVWIWCQSRAALQHIQTLYESNRLRDVLFENIQPYVTKVINIDENQFDKTAGKFLPVQP